MTMATHVGVLEGGRLAQFGPPRAIYADPDSVAVAARLGAPRINLAPVDLFGAAPHPAGAVTMGLRPEHIALGGDAVAATPARVTRVEHLGDQTRLHLRVNGHDLVTLTAPHTRAKAGDALTVAARAPLFFDGAGRRIRS